MTQLAEATVDYQSLMQDALVQIERLEAEVDGLRARRNDPSLEIVHPLLGRRLSCPLPIFSSCFDASATSWLADHRVKGAAVVPGATWLEMAIAACTAVSGEGPVTLSGVVFENLLLMAAEDRRTVQCLLLPGNDGQRRFEIHSLRAGGRSPQWLRHAHGEVATGHSAAQTGAPLSDVRFRLRKSIPADEFYEQLAGYELQYGAAYRGIVELRRRDGEALGRLQLPKSAGNDVGYCVHPLLLDAALQVLAAAAPDGQLDGESVMVPTGFDQVRYYRRPGSSCYSHVVVRSTDNAALDADFRLLDDDGRVLMELSGMHYSTFRTEPASSDMGSEQVSVSVSNAIDPAIVRQELQDGEAPQRAELLQTYLRNCAAAVLGVAPAKLDSDVSLYHWGLDSLMITKLGLQIECELGIALNPADLADDDLSLDALVSYMLEQTAGAD